MRFLDARCLTCLAVLRKSVLVRLCDSPLLTSAKCESNVVWCIGHTPYGISVFAATSTPVVAGWPLGAVSQRRICLLALLSVPWICPYWSSVLLPMLLLRSVTI